MGIVATLKAADSGTYWRCVDMAMAGRSAAYIAGYVAGRITAGTLRGNYRVADFQRFHRRDTGEYMSGFYAA